ncbi:MAG: alpha/beta hydrolase [Agitococcus sp.]
MKMRHYVKLEDNYKLPVQVIGRGQPVLMLHGFGMDAALWLPFVLPYCHKFQFYLPYFRGFGHAHGIPFNQADALANYVDDLEQLVAYFELDNFLVAGISMGALTSLKWQQQGRSWAKVVRYLHIDQSPAPCNTDDWQHGLFGEQQDQLFCQFRVLVTDLSPYQNQDFQQIPSSLRDQMRGILVSFFQHALSKPSHKKLVQFSFKSERVASLIVPTTGSWWNYLVCMQAYLEKPYDFRASLANLRTPMTVFAGMKSTMYPPQGQLAMADMVQQTVKTVCFHQSGHMPLFDEPIKFTREFGRFLAGR